MCGVPEHVGVRGKEPLPATPGTVCGAAQVRRGMSGVDRRMFSGVLGVGVFGSMLAPGGAPARYRSHRRAHPGPAQLRSTAVGGHDQLGTAEHLRPPVGRATPGAG